VELGAQVCLAGICAAILVYLRKLAAALAGASATVSMQGLAAVGIGAAAFGAGKLAGSGRNKRSAQDNIQGWKDAMQVSPASGGELGYNASKARKYAIEQMIARNEARRLAQSRESGG
jgi:type IV secretion system protein VirB6